MMMMQVPDAHCCWASHEDDSGLTRSAVAPLSLGILMHRCRKMTQSTMACRNHALKAQEARCSAEMRAIQQLLAQARALHVAAALNQPE